MARLVQCPLFPEPRIFVGCRQRPRESQPAVDRSRRSCGNPAKRKYSRKSVFRREARPRKPGSGQQGRIRWRGKSGGVRRTATLWMSAGADFWAVRVWLRQAPSSAARCRCLETAAAFLRRHAQAGSGRCRARRGEGAATSEIPRQERRARRARRKAAGRRDAGKPARRRHHADREILHPQQRADPRGDEKSRRLENHHRRRGQQQDRDHARRAEIEIQGGDAAHGAGVRRQRPRGVSRRRRAATSGPMAARAAPNGPACRSPMCSRRPA